MTGQVHALNYLKHARGGDFVDETAVYGGGDPSLRRGGAGLRPSDKAPGR